MKPRTPTLDDIRAFGLDVKTVRPRWGAFCGAPLVFVPSEGGVPARARRALRAAKFRYVHALAGHGRGWVL